MAVEPQKIKARLKALFPKANLSTTRLDALAAKLSQKPADDADDAAIDQILTDYNEDAPMTFEEIARHDDKVRTLEAKIKGQGGNEGGNGGNGSQGSQGQQQQGSEGGDNLSDEDKRIAAIVAAATKPLADKLAQLETQRTQETITERFKKDERLKGVPEFMFKGRIPASEEDFETAVTELATDYTEFAKQNKLAAFGNDAPPAGKGGPAGNKPASKAEIDAVGL